MEILLKELIFLRMVKYNKPELTKKESYTENGYLIMSKETKLPLENTLMVLKQENGSFGMEKNYLK